MNKRYRFLAAVLALSGLAAACSTEQTREELVESLTTGANPLTEAQANCVADGVEDAGIPFGLAENEATPEQIETLTDITFDCLLNG